MAGPLLRSLWSTTRKSLSTSTYYYSTKSTATPKPYAYARRAFSSAATAPAPATAPGGALDPSRLRNVAVIAHVDHGKTTLMDRLLRQCGEDIAHERALDSITLERERGITIASKVTSISWKENELNMVDTPGHADFGGEVERVVGMVEGAILVVDAGEGPLAQTKFVLAKALKYGLRPILLLNKVDRPAVSEERCDEVESLVFDLFANLGATEEQLDFPVLYASAKEGWASSTFTKTPSDDAKNMADLLDAIVRHVPPPTASLDSPFQMMVGSRYGFQATFVSMMEKDFYLGRILTGRVSSGLIRIGDRVHGLRKTDSGAEKIEEGKVGSPNCLIVVKSSNVITLLCSGFGLGVSTIFLVFSSEVQTPRPELEEVVKLMKKKGTSMVVIDSAGAGDIISMAGLTSPSIGHTVANVEVMAALPPVELDPPTISMTFGVNDSPLAGRDGTHCNFLAESGILIENMRREGFELSVSPPKVMYKTENREKLEPIEEVTVEINEEHVGLVMEALSHRRAEVTDMGPVPGNNGRTRMCLTCPSRGLVGYRSVFSSDTRGTGFMHRAFLTYAKHRGPLGNVRKGVLVSMGRGTITSYALMSLEPRGTLFVIPGMEAYDGMIVGEHSRDSDLDVNPVRAKELTNIRSAGKDDTVRLSPPRLMTLEEAIGYVASDELIEVTPKSIRLRKKYLDANKRKMMRNKPKE
ncbi:hypothetical protein RHGRI_010171 [Rhododendron griersonianum]|uniref:Tr-type G domain-containing protein n=1 Tax=Rhododendron griersonianum TaxID=479676 RepID=A0AAV6KI58_9ERIC|nr:hypothetical protein RHGRI_010171 [Rhododendron griersonianum]